MGTRKDAIVSTYKATESIKQTARILKLSHQTVRRVLLEEGLYTSDTYEQVRRMTEAGMSLQQIAQELGIREKSVSVYLPHRRNPYFELEKTSNDPLAKRLRIWKRKQRIKNKVPVVCSRETPIPQVEGQPLASVIFVPASAGLLIAKECIERLLK